MVKDAVVSGLNQKKENVCGQINLFKLSYQPSPRYGTAVDKAKDKAFCVFWVRRAREVWLCFQKRLWSFRKEGFGI